MSLIKVAYLSGGLNPSAVKTRKEIWLNQTSTTSFIHNTYVLLSRTTLANTYCQANTESCWEDGQGEFSLTPNPKHSITGYILSVGRKKKTKTQAIQRS